jgi:4-amino-4-deoxy-L-arabinose transferase-like glycosyltransferase
VEGDSTPDAMMRSVAGVSPFLADMRPGARVDRDRTRAMWLSGLGLAAILVVTLWRVTATYEVFSHTVDEPSHIAAGTQFLEHGRAGGDLTHSPLARIAVAIGPRLLAWEGRSVCATDREEQLLRCKGEPYWRTLTAGRLGTLPFLVLMLVTAWLWGTQFGGPLTGFMAALLLANAPPVLAHSGLATTDAAAAATVSLTLLVFVRWLHRPTLPRALALGVAAGLALGTKLTACVYLPAAGVAMTIVVLSRHRLQSLTGAIGQLGGALIASFFVLWAIYGFTLNPLVGPAGLVDDDRGLAPVLHWAIFPLVEMGRGLETLAELNRSGVPSYFMGQISPDGWWSFFPVMFAVKTPLALLALFALGIVVAAHRWTERPGLLAAAAAAVAILGVAMTSRINLGLRHVLVLYPLASIVAGAGAAAMIEMRGRAAKPVRGLTLLLIAWLVVDSARAHPDYIPYFNEAARADAAYFSADSDLDWGQDAKRVADELSRRRIEHASVAMNTTAKLLMLAPVDVTDLWPGQPASGWVAASVGRILNDRIRPPYLGLRWLECHRPVARIGATTFLYRIAPGAAGFGETLCGLGNLAAPRR